jgi:hypothetical protein
MPSLDFDNVKSNKGSSNTPDSMPDKLIKEDLQQPHQIKISFEEGSKDIKINLKKLQS